MFRRWYPDPDRIWVYRRRPAGKRVNPTNPKFITARDGAREFRETFDRPQLVFKKTLGWGGFGVAMKYEQLDANQQHVADIAVKIPVSDDESKIRGFKREMRYYMTFEVSEHIPRLLHFPPAMTEIQEDGTQLLPTGNDQFWEENSSLSPLVHYAMIVEYLGNDDMYELIYKLENAYERDYAAQGLHEVIPNRILWRFFLCYAEVQAIIAAQRDKPGSRSASTETAWHEDLSDHGEESYLVHKDLDPGNIFMGVPSPGDAEHQFHPIAKIADFGLMEYATSDNQDR
ncbi:kinase-like domain-containing protein [Apiospora arundinis]|uniref:Kinase-like domain-containing protein n=1 Tax=Apiospora arundinis TaxID=335852 RepID=A0ABR2HRZ4_9PEZI